MRVSRDPSDPSQSLGNFQAGKVLVTINRQDYWQCGFLIPKGTLDQIKKKGIDAFQNEIAETAPYLRERVGETR